MEEIKVENLTEDEIEKKCVDLIQELEKWEQELFLGVLRLRRSFDERTDQAITIHEWKEVSRSIYDAIKAKALSRLRLETECPINELKKAQALVSALEIQYVHHDVMNDDENFAAHHAVVDILDEAIAVLESTFE